jgi:outer membrane receptor for monomeric catechols
VPNGIALPANWAVNLAAVETITPRTELRLSVVNVTDNIYEIRNGTGVGVGAPQFGQRRTILAGVTEKF